MVIVEPAGEPSRLVVYKMILENFKSYAGRVEVGPFNSVRFSHPDDDTCRQFSSFFCAYRTSPLLLDPMALEKVILLTLCCLYLGIEHQS